jgi:hypothetical protein
MKTRPLILALLLAAAVEGAFFLAACTTTGTAPAPTSQQQAIAAAVEDTISIGLVPVLTKNASYIPAARTVALALGSFDGATLTPADVQAFVAKTPLAPEDARTIAAMVNAAWSTYTRRYQAQAGTALRPDVKLFLGAVAAGIGNAIAAVPPASS